MWRAAHSRRSTTSRAPVTAPLEEPEPLPPAYRPLLRGTIVLALLWAAILATWYAWSVHADRPLQAERAAWQAEGLLYPRDAHLPPPASQNAAVLLVEAEAFQDSRRSIYEGTTGSQWGPPPWNDADRSVVAWALERRRPALDLIAAATTRPAVCWSDHAPARPDAWYGPDGLPSPWRGLPWTIPLLGAAAELAAQRGDQQAFWDHVDQMAFVAAALDKAPGWYARRCATQLEDDAASTVDRYAHSLPLARGSPCRPRAERLIADWAAGDPNTAARLRLYYADLARHAFRWEGLDGAVVSRRAGQNLWDRAVSRAVLPASELCIADDVAHLRQEAIALGARDTNPGWTTVAGRLPGPKWLVEIPPVKVEPADTFLKHVAATAYTQRDAILAAYQAVAARRMAAVSLAARLYAEDHAGAAPPTLAALVPDYLAAIPVDPFDPAGAPLRYRGPAATTRPFIYSLGETGIDLITTAPRDPPLELHHHFDRGNVPVFLNPATGPIPAK